MNSILCNYPKGNLWFAWILAAIIMSACIFLFVYAGDHWPVTNGEFGDLLSGTIGVGASIGAMIFVIVTLSEQRKMNKQLEVHHLVENFNSVFDRFMNHCNSFSEADYKDSIKVKTHLEELWNGENQIRSNLNLITKKIRHDTRNTLISLQAFTNDEDLIRISRTLNRLWSIKCKIAELDPDAVKRVDEDWKSIRQIWKEYAGFFFAWNSINSTKSKENSELSEMVDLFCKLHDEKLPEYIPQISVRNPPEEIFKESLSEFLKQKIVFISKSPFSIIVKGVNLAGYSYNNPGLSIKVGHIEILPIRENIFSFQVLFGEKVGTVFNHLKGAPISKETNSKRTLYQEIVLDYHNKEWIYENTIEYNNYDDGNKSILYQEIPNTNPS